MKKRILLSSVFLFLFISSLFAITIVSTKITDYLLKDKDESSDTKYYGFVFSDGVNKNWYGMKVSSTTIGYVVGKTTTTYSDWWEVRTSTAYYNPSDVNNNSRK